MAYKSVASLLVGPGTTAACPECREYVTTALDAHTCDKEDVD